MVQHNFFCNNCNELKSKKTIEFFLKEQS
ncbi:zinc-ribbon domain-containing protein [Ilyobacter polytropus]